MPRGFLQMPSGPIQIFGESLHALLQVTKGPYQTFGALRMIEVLFGRLEGSFRRPAGPFRCSKDPFRRPENHSDARRTHSDTRSFRVTKGPSNARKALQAPKGPFRS